MVAHRAAKGGWEWNIHVITCTEHDSRRTFNSLLTLQLTPKSLRTGFLVLKQRSLYPKNTKRAVTGVSGARGSAETRNELLHENEICPHEAQKIATFELV